MERLTNSDKEIPTLSDNAEYWLKAYFKLKDYEDLEELIGVSLKDLTKIFNDHIPEDCKNPKNAMVLTDDDVDKWNEYKKAEEQGLLLRLPCKVGDTVYYISEGFIEPYLLEYIPTAYDVDKVVEKLEKQSKPLGIGFIPDERYIKEEKAIEIVKQVGVSDDVCEWKGKEKEFIQNPHTKRLYSNEESVKNCYCNTCGKKIKVVE